MWMYIAIIIIPVLLYFFPVKQKNFALYSMLAVLFVVSTFRSGNMGADYNRYIYYFHKIGQTGNAYFTEKGYVLLNYLVSKLSDEHWLLACFINIMLFVPLTIYTKRVMQETKYWILVILVFLLNPYMYLQTTFNALRQCCATGILLLSEKYLREKKYLIYFGIVCLAAQFHNAAIFTLLLPVAMSVKWTKRKWLILSIVSFLASITVVGPMLDLVMYFVEKLTKYGKYSGYEASLLDNIPYMVFILVYLLVMVSQYNSLADDMESKWHIDLHLLVVWMLFFTVKNDAFYRTRIMFSFIALGSLPRVFSRIDALKRERANLFFVKYGNLFKALHVAYYICFWLGYIGYLWLQGNTAYVPYQFCF